MKRKKAFEREVVAIYGVAGMLAVCPEKKMKGSEKIWYLSAEA